MACACPPCFCRFASSFRKNKFCGFCGGKRGSLFLPASRVRGVPESLHETLVNSSKSGLWSTHPQLLHGAKYRVINNTAGCSLPRLIIFESEAPPPIWGKGWVPLGSEWIGGGFIRLCVSRGTLVPATHDANSQANAPVQAIFGGHGGSLPFAAVGGQPVGGDGIFRIHTSVPVGQIPVAPHSAAPSGGSSSGVGPMSTSSCCSGRSVGCGSEASFPESGGYSITTPFLPSGAAARPRGSGAAMPMRGAASHDVGATGVATALPHGEVVACLGSAAAARPAVSAAGANPGNHDLVMQASTLFDLALNPADRGGPTPGEGATLPAGGGYPAEGGDGAGGPFAMGPSHDPLEATILKMHNPFAATDPFADAVAPDRPRVHGGPPVSGVALPPSSTCAVPSAMASAMAAPVPVGYAPAAVQRAGDGTFVAPAPQPPKASRHQSKRLKPHEGTPSSWPVGSSAGAGANGGAGGGNGGTAGGSANGRSNASEQSSQDSMDSSSSWSTGAYLLARFKDFSSHLAEKRRQRKQRSTSSTPAGVAHKVSDSSTGLKLSIIEKLGSLLETGDDNQLEHIEKYLIDLNLDGTGVLSQMMDISGRGGGGGGGGGGKAKAPSAGAGSSGGAPPRAPAQIGGADGRPSPPPEVSCPISQFLSSLSSPDGSGVSEEGGALGAMSMSTSASIPLGCPGVLPTVE